MKPISRSYIYRMAAGTTKDGEAMTRKPTIVYDGAIYHLIQRGNNRAYIYNDQLDKAKFCDILKETMALEDCAYKLLYYVLMDNHYHLVIETLTAPIDRIMHRINLVYAKYFNKKYGRTGVLYEGRYARSLILDTGHLMSVIRYIAYNPVRAELVKSPADYRWCAHLDVLSMKRGLVDVKGLLDKFDRHPQKALDAYVHLISGRLPEPQRRTEAIDKISQKRMVSLEIMLISDFKDETQRTYICQGSKSPHIIALRKDFAERAYLAGFYAKEIAQILNMSPRAVQYMLRGTRAKLPEMAGME